MHVRKIFNIFYLFLFLQNHILENRKYEMQNEINHSLEERKYIMHVRQKMFNIFFQILERM